MGHAEWIALAALLLGAMALPTVFQMFWGRPQITFWFNRVEDERDTLLLIHLQNFPIGNRVLSWMGVSREEAHFHVVVTVRDDGGNQILKYTEPPISSGDPFKPNQYHLHAGPSPITLETLGANGQHARIYYEEKPNSYHDFPPGNYLLRLDVWVGERIFFEERTFVVTGNSRKSYWADN